MLLAQHTVTPITELGLETYFPNGEPTIAWHWEHRAGTQYIVQVRPIELPLAPISSWTGKFICLGIDDPVGDGGGTLGHKRPFLGRWILQAIVGMRTSGLRPDYSVEMNAAVEETRAVPSALRVTMYTRQLIAHRPGHPATRVCQVLASLR